jgi:hypothetical protein
MRLSVFVLLLCGRALYAQTGSEIYLFDFKELKSKIVLDNPRNITNHPGYDNQPFFHPHQPVVYYTSFDDQGRADLHRYNYKTNTHTAITSTPEREYSPTVTPDQQSLSCIIQRDNGAQDLGRYPIDGGEPFVIIDNLKVGYHVWADNSHLALFVLGGATQDNTLHYVQLPTKRDTVIAKGIGRSLHKIPHQRAISFIHKLDERNWLIKKLDTKTLTTAQIAATLPAREDICWTPKGKLLGNDGTDIFYFDTDAEVWKPVEMKTKLPGIKGITRMAVNAAGNTMAVVVSE